MKRVSIVTVAALAAALVLPASASFAATKKTPLCHNAALSKDDQAECSSQLMAAKTKSAKSKVRGEYQAKIDAAKKAK